MNKEELLRLSKTISLDYEPGVAYEIYDHLMDQESVKSYEYEFRDQTHFITIYIEEANFNIPFIRKAFHSLVFEITYDSVFYVSNYNEKDCITYLLLSKMRESNYGFMADIEFKVLTE